MDSNVYIEEDFRDGIPGSTRTEKVRFERGRFQGAPLAEWEADGVVFDRCRFVGPVWLRPAM